MDWAELVITDSDDWMVMPPPHEIEFIAKMKEWTTEDDVVVEVGAHQGVYTTLFAKKARFVHAIEPVPENRRLLYVNLSRNDLSNVKVYDYALSDYSGKGEMAISIYGTGTHKLKKPRIKLEKEFKQRLAVQVEKLDNLNIDQMDILKIDIEGGEIEMLRGAQELITRFHPKIAIEVHNTADDIRLFAEKHDYRVEESGHFMYLS